MSNTKLLRLSKEMDDYLRNNKPKDMSLIQFSKIVAKNLNDFFTIDVSFHPAERRKKIKTTLIFERKKRRKDEQEGWFI